VTDREVIQAIKQALGTTAEGPALIDAVRALKTAKDGARIAYCLTSMPAPVPRHRKIAEANVPTSDR